MYNQNLFSNKRILVTGGGSGLGLELATYFASLGAHVIINGRNQEKLKAAAELINSHKLGKADFIAADVREEQQVKALFAKIASDHGQLTDLLNNAAGNFLCASEDLSINAFKSVVDIVLTGTFLCTQEFGKACIAAKTPGNVLSIVTTYAETGSAFVLPSACAKAGVVALTKTLAYEWAEFNIRVNAIAPGPFPTKGAWARLVPSKDFEDQYKKSIPLGRFGRPEELAALATFLLSDLAAFISGEVVTIDGAEHLKNGQFNFLLQQFSRDTLKQSFSAMRKSGA